MKSKLQQAEDDLKGLGENLKKMKDFDLTSLESKLSATSSSAQEEKKQLKKDIKELININDRLRTKLKDLTAAYEKLKTDKESERNDLYEELQKAKQTTSELEDDVQKRTRSVCDLEEKVQQLSEQVNDNNELTRKYENAIEENARLQGKVQEFVKVTDLQKSITEPELHKLRDEVLKLTRENSILKIQKLEIDTDKEEKNELLTSLSNLKQRNQSLQDELRVQNANNKHVHGELTHCKEMVSQLEKKLAGAANIEQQQLTKMQNELNDVKQSKSLLEKQLRLVSNGLEPRLEPFSPPHTSSQQNIALSSDVFTQTIVNNHNNSNYPGQHSKFLEEDNSLLAMHIKEMRELRKQLEETRRNNDALRKQLEDRLSQVEQDAAKLHDPQLKVTLIRDNDAMRAKLAESEASQERMKIHIDELLREKRS